MPEVSSGSSGFPRQYREFPWPLAPVRRIVGASKPEQPARQQQEQQQETVVSTGLVSTAEAAGEASGSEAPTRRHTRVTGRAGARVLVWESFPERELARLDADAGRRWRRWLGALLIGETRDHEAAPLRLGVEGQHLTAALLGHDLPEGFVLLTPLELPGWPGHDLDAVVVGPTGVIVLETKHVAGAVACGPGEAWDRAMRGRGGGHYAGRIGNPSAQVRGGVRALRTALQRDPTARRLCARTQLWIEAMVVFSHPAVDLRDTSHSPVPVLRLAAVPAAVCGARPRRPLTSADVDGLVAHLAELGDAAAGAAAPAPGEAHGHAWPDHLASWLGVRHGA